jgi:RNA polymerase sigma-70 factor (ECF subfamily)
MPTPPPLDAHESHEIFMQLLARHEPVIRGYLRSLVSRAADVDELMPDVALVAWRKFSELLEPEAFPRWVCVIARYEALRLRRDRARDRLVLDEAVIALLADEGAGETPLRVRQMAAMEGCVGRLPAERRDLLLACYASETAIKDIAAQTGRTVDGLYQLLRRIRVEVQRCVEGTLKHEASS